MQHVFIYCRTQTIHSQESTGSGKDEQHCLCGVMICRSSPSQCHVDCDVNGISASESGKLLMISVAAQMTYQHPEAAAAVVTASSDSNSTHQQL